MARLTVHIDQAYTSKSRLVGQYGLALAMTIAPNKTDGLSNSDGLSDTTENSNESQSRQEKEHGHLLVDPSAMTPVEESPLMVSVSDLLTMLAEKLKKVTTDAEKTFELLRKVHSIFESALKDQTEGLNTAQIALEWVRDKPLETAAQEKVILELLRKLDDIILKMENYLRQAIKTWEENRSATDNRGEGWRDQIKDCRTEYMAASKKEKDKLETEKKKWMREQEILNEMMTERPKNPQTTEPLTAITVCKATKNVSVNHQWPYECKENLNVASTTTIEKLRRVSEEGINLLLSSMLAAMEYWVSEAILTLITHEETDLKKSVSQIIEVLEVSRTHGSSTTQKIKSDMLNAFFKIADYEKAKEWIEEHKKQYLNKDMASILHLLWHVRRVVAADLLVHKSLEQMTSVRSVVEKSRELIDKKLLSSSCFYKKLKKQHKRLKKLLEFTQTKDNHSRWKWWK